MMSNSRWLTIEGANEALIGEITVNVQDPSYLLTGHNSLSFTSRGNEIVTIRLETLDHTLSDEVKFKMFGEKFTGKIVSKENLNDDVATFTYIAMRT